MDLLSSIRKEGSRGGVDFKWSDVSTSQHRENYLGHSLMAPVGRWQKNRDLSWYAKADCNSTLEGGETADEKKTRERKEEIRRIKEAEEDALARALGLPVADRGVTGANAIEVGEIRRAVKEAEVEAADDGGRFGEFVGKVEDVEGDEGSRQMEKGGLLGGKPKEKEKEKEKVRRHRRREERSRSRSREHRGRRQRHRDGDEKRAQREKADRERRPRSQSLEGRERERRHRSRSDGRYRARSRSLDEREKSRRSRIDERYHARTDDREGRRGRDHVPRRSLSPEARERQRKRSRSPEPREQERRRSRSAGRREAEKRRSRSPAPRERERERRRDRGRDHDGDRRQS